MADRLVPMPNGGFQKVASLEDRYWSKVDKRGPDECWLWTGFANGEGRGFIRSGMRMVPASHVALRFDGRPRPEAPNDHALHGDQCVSPGCCNPAHLRWGSHRENMADRERLGRNKVPHVRGERQGRSKLTENAVRAIRAAEGRHEDIAVQFGCTKSNVQQIKSGKTWRHVQ